MSTNVIRIAEDGTVTEHDTETMSEHGPNFRRLGALVEGMLESLSSANGVLENHGLIAYGNDEGRIIGMEINVVASILLGYVGNIPALVGPVIITAEDTYDEETDTEGSLGALTAEQIEHVMRATNRARVQGIVAGYLPEPEHA
jgi:hypothetical protein